MFSLFVSLTPKQKEGDIKNSAPEPRSSNPRGLSVGEVERGERSLTTEFQKLEFLMSHHCSLELKDILKIRIVDFNWKDWQEDIEQEGRCTVIENGEGLFDVCVPAFLMMRLARFFHAEHYWNSFEDKFFVVGGGKFNLRSRERRWTMQLKRAGIEAGLDNLTPSRLANSNKNREGKL